jgi:hypothetical protein
MLKPLTLLRIGLLFLAFVHQFPVQGSLGL